MYFPEYDDEKDIGSSSLVDNDTQQMEEGTAEGNTFLSNLRGIWATIEGALDTMNDPFAGDDISPDEANNAYNTITTEYARLLTRYYNCGDDETPCLTPTKIDSSSQSSRSTPPTAQSNYSQLTSSVFGSPSDWLGDVLNEEPASEETASPLSQPKYGSWMKPSSSSNSSPNIGTSGYSTPPLSSQSPGDKQDSGLTHATGASKSIIAEAFEEESLADKLAIQSVATSILSGAFRQEKMDVKKALAQGDASKVYKLIAKILYKQKVAIDVRNGATRGKGNEWQMKEIWGSYITNFAKSAGARCYLCGGQIVPSDPGGGQPEMEHKLPCAVFYAKFAFIYSCFANELIAWRTYVVNLPDNSRLMQYYKLMNSTDNKTFNQAQTDRMYKTISDDFLSSMDMSSLDESNLRLFTDFILPAYLSEFAYCHSLCNRLKSNHDLSKEEILTKYYEGLQAILNGRNGKCNTAASKGILNPACIDEDFCNAERGAILAGLRGKIPLRKTNVQAQMTYLNSFASKYAEESKTTEKRMILRIIKETIRTMQVKTSSVGKVTKKEIKQMNVQARIIAQGLLLNTTDVYNFLVQLNKDNITGTEESERLQNKARDRVNIYLDRIHQIFENVYDTPDDIKRQLNNAYVSPAIKIRIYNNTNAYYNALNGILDNINDKIDKLGIMRVSLGDNNEMLGECESFVSNLNRDIIEKYEAKILEWQKPINVVAPKVPVARPKSSATSTLLGIQKPGQKMATEKQKKKQPVARRDKEMNVVAENALNTAGLKRRRPVIKLTDDEVRILEAEKREALRQKAIQQNIERANRAQAKDKFDGGRRRQIKTTRKLKRRPRKTTKLKGRRKRTMKRTPKSRKNTRRR